MKPPALITTSSSLGDLLSITPTVRKLFYTYGTKIVVASHIPDLLKNNPFISENLHIEEIDYDSFEKKHTVHKTFHLLGKRDPLGIEFKHAMCDIRQFHAKDLGFLLTPEEMTCDFFPDPEDSCMSNLNIPEKYVVVHPAQTWDSRTWEKEKWQELVDLLNNLGISVVAIGKNSGEQSDHLRQDKPAWSLDIKMGLDLTNKTNLSQSWYILNKAECVITMDSGILHLAGTTDVHIIQLGSSINPRFRAPYRYGSQEYKYSYVPGGCLIHCASDLSYSLRDWGNIQSVTLINTCLENKPSFECKPSVKSVFDEVVRVLEGNPQKIENSQFPVYQKEVHPNKNIGNSTKWEEKILITYNSGPKVEILGENGDPRSFEVFFIDSKTNDVVHKDNLKINHWSKASRKWFTKWIIEVWCEGDLIKKDVFDLEDKEVLISITSKALGDTIAWSPYCLEFQKLHKCKLTVRTFHPKILESIFSDSGIKILHAEKLSVDDDSYYANFEVTYGVDVKIHSEEMGKINKNFGKRNKKLFSDAVSLFDENTNPNHPHFHPLAAVAPSILGMEYKEIRPHIPNPYQKRPIEKKYICISEFASAPGLKEWNNQVGWQKLVDYFKSNGFEVVSISSEKSKLNNVTKRNGYIDLEERIWYLHHCEFFVGVSSGLAWLAWACGKKVVMISGATQEWNEFQEDNIRIINKEVCNGCWNTQEHAEKFGCFHSSLCPENKNFECTRRISAQFVIDMIKQEIPI